MAPGVCVASFRMLMRRTELGGHFRRGLRLMPTGTHLVNSWSTTTRRFCTKNDNTRPVVQNSQNSGKTKTINEKPSSPENNPKAKIMQTHIQTSLLDENLEKDADISQMKVSQLRAELRAHGLNVVGKKEKLVQRLQNYLQLKNRDHHIRIVSSSKDEEVNLKSEIVDNDEKSIEKINEKQEDYEKDIEVHRSESFADQQRVLVGSETSMGPDFRTEIPAMVKLNLSATPAIIKNATDNVDIKIEDPLNSNYTSNINNNISNNRTSTEIVPTATSNNSEKNDHLSNSNSEKHSIFSDNINNGQKHHDQDVFVEYIQGLPHITVPLPSRMEKCRFALRPVSHKVGDLIEMLKTEDHGIDRAIVLNRCGVRIASTCAIDSLMDEPFCLQINDNKYQVTPPERKKMDPEDTVKLSDVRTLVAQLYEALHVGEYHIHKEQELLKRLENLKFEVSPLELRKEELSKQAERKTVIATWVGLSLMAVQFGVLARLTWWEYSWDIMEPVTYFVTYGTTMAMYAYYCTTKQEYNFGDVKNRLFLLTVHKKAQKKRFDVERYNLLKKQIAEIEFDLRRLRDPLNMQLPPHIDRSQRDPPPTTPPSGSDGDKRRLVTEVTCEKKPPSFRLPFFEPKKFT